MKHSSIQSISVRLWLILLLIALTLASVSVQAQDTEVVWAAWENKDVTTLSNDNTGALFTLSQEVKTPSGKPSVQVLPSGKAEETKLVFKVSGSALQEWNTYQQVALEVYLPATNARIPNRFFLGMADVTKDSFTWLAGVFGEVKATANGWIIVYYRIDPAMQHLEVDNQYNLYLSFFHEMDGKKVALSEPFHLGAILLSQPLTTTAPVDQQTFQNEVDTLLKLDDAALLDAVGHETFLYFWEQANPKNGLVKDRGTSDSVASMAAVGFGLASIPVAVERGWLDRDQGYARVKLTLQTFLNGGVQGQFGFYYHFVDMQTGKRVWDSELSSIDTALLAAGALTAGQYFKGTEVETLAQQLYERIEWDTFAPYSKLISMGWIPDGGFFRNTWDHFDESLLMYLLAIGSPTHPISAEAWDLIERPVNVAGQYIYLPGEPLFVYQYPLAFADLNNREDKFANYFNNTTRACQRNRQFSQDNAEQYKTYQNNVWGISASDGPQGYQAYGAATGNHDGTIAPYASIACLPFTPQASLQALRAMLSTYGAKVWGEYGFVSAINADANWYSGVSIGIDQGDILLMIANYQDGFIWKLFMQNDYVQRAIQKIGFIEKTSDYAVTPAFLASFK